MNFLTRLQTQRSDYKYPSQARTQAESLKQLSAGIYTEEERFIYELLQNAVDAFIDTSNESLHIKIEIINNTLCFMHNGAPFSEKDIESLCDVGNSNKATDAKVTNKKKVGYKGIGFKSVFMQSVDYVCVRSGNYCFKFDKMECVELMPNFVDEQLDADEIPWQIIPIPCKSPSGFDVSGYNVATYIKTNSINNLHKKIKKLLEDPQFLLFLNVDDIDIAFYNNGYLLSSAGRITSNNEVHLLCNNNIVSRWLVHTTDPIPVSNSVRDNLKYDFNTPQKLKEAKHFELSFAISINDAGEIEEIKDSVVYTFLPTSYNNLGVPFLINANFITDAGRQQLHQNSEWNRLIFSSIPKYFFTWIAKLAPHHQDYYKTLPNKYPKSSDDLTDIYESSLIQALKDIPFIPRIIDNKVIKVSESIIDKVSFSNVIGDKDFIDYINKKYSKEFEIYNFVPNIASSIFNSYGVFTFGKNRLSKYLIESSELSPLCIEKDIALINYLYDYTHNDDNSYSDLSEIIKKSDIILDEDYRMNKPVNLFRPLKQDSMLDEFKNISFINKKVYNALSIHIISWLEELGIKELSKISFVQYVLSNPTYITIENAIETGRILFETWKRENYLDDGNNTKQINVLPFLSKGGKLVPISNLYLSSEYHPDDDIEPTYSQIDYISSNYANNNDYDDWAFFLKKCGIRCKLSITNTIIKENTSQWNHLIEKYNFLESAADSLRNKKHGYSGYSGYKNPIINKTFVLNYFSYINPEEINFDFYTLAFTKILGQKFNPTTIKDEIRGSISFWGTKVCDNLSEHVPNSFSSKYNSFLEYVITNEQKYPTLKGTVELARDTFLNTPTIIKYGGQYLPTIAISSQVDESWLKFIPFKKELLLEDYLLILENISIDYKTDNKERISLIYQRLVELGFQNSIVIKEWGKKHKILSTSNSLYISPQELSFITIEGFKNNNQVYVGKYENSLKEGILQLLENFGVKVITDDKINPQFINELPSNDFKKMLLDKIDYITLLREGVKNKESFEKVKQEISLKINECEFFHCDKITLSYGDDNDIIIKNTFVKGNKIYYVGSLKPTKIEPIIAPLSKYLRLRNVAEELLIILITNDLNDLNDYFKDKGYRIDLIDIKQYNNPNHNIHNLNKYIDENKGLSIDLENKYNHVKENHKNMLREYEKEFSEKLKLFMGSNYSIPSNNQVLEHMISRYRILMYLKQQGYLFKEDFDEREFVKHSGYMRIPLLNGKYINPQGAKNGIWHLAPSIWKDIVEIGNWACLCTGNNEEDFIMIKDEGNIKTIAESTKNVYMRLTATSNLSIIDTIKSVLSVNNTRFNEDILYNKIYTNRDVHLMLMIHPTTEPILNSMFDNIFKTEGDYNIE